MTVKEYRVILRRWGNASYACKEWQREISQMQTLIDSARDITGVQMDSTPVQSSPGNPTESKAMQAIKVEEKYLQRIEELNTLIDRQLSESNSVDEAISKLSPDEQNVLIMRYKERQPWSTIGRRLYMARETAQRIEFRAIYRIVNASTVRKRS